jgi:hypothetical protein
MTALLASSTSPEQRAYLLKTLAAGYNIDQVAKLNSMIAAHGDDPAWLQQHLSPLGQERWSATGDHVDITFNGAEWTQGQYPTCVASSTVTARAAVDPLYALQLTTGGHPDDPKFDNSTSFASRLRDEQERVYDGGRSWDQKLFGTDGMTNDQSESIANEEIAPHTGTRYDNMDVDNADARRASLDPIERAVDEGYPVPFSTSDKTGGHQMMVIGHQGSMLQIYNPWGYTVWVKEDDFINGHMDQAGNGVPTTPNSVRIPHK